MKIRIIAAFAVIMAAAQPTLIHCTIQKKFPRTLAGKIKHFADGTLLTGLAALEGYFVYKLVLTKLELSKKTSPHNHLGAYADERKRLSDLLTWLTPFLGSAGIYTGYKLCNAGCHSLKQAFSEDPHEEIIEEEEEEELTEDLKEIPIEDIEQKNSAETTKDVPAESKTTTAEVIS